MYITLAWLLSRIKRFYFSFIELSDLSILDVTFAFVNDLSAAWLSLTVSLISKVYVGVLWAVNVFDVRPPI